MSADIIDIDTGSTIIESEEIDEDRVSNTHARFDHMKSMLDDFLDNGYDMSKSIIIAPHEDGAKTSCLFVNFDPEATHDMAADLLIEAYTKANLLMCAESIIEDREGFDDD